ncbi:AAA family ATPase [Pannonibacter sp. Q-1]
MPQPSCIILGGPNGSGKTSAFAKLNLDGVWVNADEIARALPGSGGGKSRERRASEIVLRQLSELVGARQPFVFEATLSSRHSINLMSRAKAAGFLVGLYYVALDDVETNIERVRQRVLKGGHDIPETVIRERYKRSLDNLAEALRLADEVLLIDNSAIQPHEVIRICAGEVKASAIDEGKELHRLFSAKVCEAYALVHLDGGFKTTSPIRPVQNSPTHDAEPDAEE